MSLRAAAGGEPPGMMIVNLQLLLNLMGSRAAAGADWRRRSDPVPAAGSYWLLRAAADHMKAGRIGADCMRTREVAAAADYMRTGRVAAAVAGRDTGCTGPVGDAPGRKGVDPANR